MSALVCWVERVIIQEIVKQKSVLCILQQMYAIIKLLLIEVTGVDSVEVGTFQAALSNPILTK